MQTDSPVIHFDTQLMAEDLAAKGWLRAELARRAKVSDASCYRFFQGRQRTATVAKKLAKALGQKPERYIRGLRRVS